MFLKAPLNDCYTGFSSKVTVNENQLFSVRHFRLLNLISSLQGGEYGTDEEEDDEEEVSPPYPSAIEVFDLAENEHMSPLETDPEKLAHKYKEVRSHLLNWSISCVITAAFLRCT